MTRRKPPFEAQRFTDFTPAAYTAYGTTAVFCHICFCLGGFVLYEGCDLEIPPYSCAVFEAAVPYPSHIIPLVSVILVGNRCKRFFCGGFLFFSILQIVYRYTYAFFAALDTDLATSGVFFALF